MSKTFTSVAIALAVAEARFSFDDLVLDLLPQFRSVAAGGLESITVRHLLTMPSGIVYRWEHPDFDHSGDPAEVILSTSLGLKLRPREIARLGRTLLNGGTYRDQQVIPREYVAEMGTTSTAVGDHRPTNSTQPVSAVGYGLGVWICGREGAWRMDGIYGQFSIIGPGRGACVTATAHYTGDATVILDSLWATLISNL